LSWANVLAGVIAALYFTREIAIPFAFALTLTFLLTPAVKLIERLHAGRVVSVLVTALAAIAAALGIGWIVAYQLVDVASQLPHYRQNIHAKIEALHIPAAGPLGRAAASVKEIAQEVTGPDAPVSPAQPMNRKQPNAQPSVPPTPAAPMPVQMVEPPATRWTELRDLGLPILGPLARAGMVIIFTIFMLFQREDLRNRLLRLVGLGQLNLMTQALDDAASRVSRYLLL